MAIDDTTHQSFRDLENNPLRDPSSVKACSVVASWEFHQSHWKEKDVLSFGHMRTMAAVSLGFPFLTIRWGLRWGWQTMATTFKTSKQIFILCYKKVLMLGG